MSSILNSISSGELQVQHVPEVKPVKEDSVIDLLQDVEIEFELPKKPEPETPPIIFEDISMDTVIDDVIPDLEDVSDLFQNIEIELSTCPKLETNLDDINTGFGANDDLHYESPCTRPSLNTPLYKERYLSEFVTEEEKASARHALGLYNKEDIVAMSLLTSEEGIPSQEDWKVASIQQLRKGDKFFTPLTSFNAVFDPEGVSLAIRMLEINSLVSEQQRAISIINNPSNTPNITSLGDVKKFLQGFTNGDNLHTTIDTMNKEMLRFEKTGQLI